VLLCDYVIKVSLFVLLGGGSHTVTGASLSEVVGGPCGMASPEASTLLRFTNEDLVLYSSQRDELAPLRIL